MAYDPDNIFAKIIRGELPACKVYEDEDTFSFMDLFPQTKGCLKGASRAYRWTSAYWLYPHNYASS